MIILKMKLEQYNYFEQLVHEYNAKYLLTAHHGDDLMETILMRIARGSTLRGYSGFSKISSFSSIDLIELKSCGILIFLIGPFTEVE